MLRKVFIFEAAAQNRDYGLVVHTMVVARKRLGWRMEMVESMARKRTI